MMMIVGKKGSQTPTLSTDGYEVKGETFNLAPNDKHKFYYAKDMVPDEVMLLKCFDSRGEGMSNGIPGLAVRALLSLL